MFVILSVRSLFKKLFCDVFNCLESQESHQIGYRNNVLIRDVPAFDKLSKFYDANLETKWRSGIKHDCSNIMEFRKIGNVFVNGTGEKVELEDIYLFPLLKGSDVAQNRTQTTDRYVLVTQRFVGEPTDRIKELAPQTWQYLESRENYLENRKSKIYRNNPRFSVFGVGAYSFASWKIAICGLYKKLEFRLIGKICDRPIFFDDTVYFLSFEDELVARKTFALLTSTPAIDFYASLIFWDEKRPIKSSILNSLNLTALESEIATLSDRGCYFGR